MRILYTGDADSVHLQRWVAEMHRRGAECHVLTRRPAAMPGAASVQAVRPGDDGAGWLLALPRVRALARALAPDLVHGHYVTSNGLWAASCGVRPVVLTAWGSDLLVTPSTSTFKRLLTRAVLARADLVTGDSADLVAAARALGSRAPCHEIHWGADCERFVPGVPRESTAFTVLSLRAWEPNYRLDVLLDAFAELCRRAPQCRPRLRLLGGGRLEAALRAQAARLGIVEAVDFVGREDDAGMVRAMQDADVAVSVPASDATSVSLLECLACGLPVVASDLPANRAWVDADGGRLVPAGDAAALAQALRDLAADAVLRRAMGAHNRRVALARASRRTQMDRMAALYDSLLAQATPRLA